MPTRLTPLDVSFLEVESPSAHMHVGWVAVFDPPAGGPPPSFEQLYDHIARRLPRAARYRQRLARVPLGLARPVWVDDDRFTLAHHVRRSPTGGLSELADRVMSTPLGHDRPLWELWIADRLDDERIGVVGKAHHCMVDGIAAVELASLLLDPTPEAAPDEPDGWCPEPPPGAVRLLAEGVADRVREELELATLPARIASSPARLAGMARSFDRGARALADSLVPARPVPALNEPLSPYRHLSMLTRPLDELRATARARGATINDLLLAAAAGGVRCFLEERGEEAPRLKAMVPANVRGEEAGGELGNRISFMFLDLPCDEADPLRRLGAVHDSTAERKESGAVEGADAVLRLLTFAPMVIQRALSRMAASERTFNLVVSNIPGPSEPMYMRGCRLAEAYPVVPLADRHNLSIGFTTIAGGAFLGVYADPDALPDADRLAGHIGASLDELRDAAPGTRRPVAAAPA